MKIINLGNNNTIFNHFISQIRNVQVQNDSMRFRRNIERIGEVFAYEISKHMQYVSNDITTPLGISKQMLMNHKPVLATILRAGLPLHQGLLNYFDNSDSAFISAYRKHSGADNFEIEIEYMASPNLDGQTLILSDPMIASGASMVLAMQAILSKGTPKHIHIVGNGQCYDFSSGAITCQSDGQWCGFEKGNTRISSNKKFCGRSSNF